MLSALSCLTTNHTDESAVTPAAAPAAPSAAGGGSMVTKLLYKYTWPVDLRRAGAIDRTAQHALARPCVQPQPCSVRPDPTRIQKLHAKLRKRKEAMPAMHAMHVLNLVLRSHMLSYGT